jgi:hypothetical protein
LENNWDRAANNKSSMNRIVIQTPARLHFGLLDLNGSLGRIDGGIGLALEELQNRQHYHAQ